MEPKFDPFYLLAAKLKFMLGEAKLEQPSKKCNSRAFVPVEATDNSLRDIDAQEMLREGLSKPK